MSISKKESTESRKLLTFKQRPRSREFPLADGLCNREIPWPENACGFVIAKQQLEDFIGNQTLYQAQATARRFIIVAAAARSIAGGENREQNWRLIRYIASEDESGDNGRLMKMMISAIEKGGEGIRAVLSTTMYMLDFGFEYMTSYNKEMIYEEGLMSMMKATERRR